MRELAVLECVVGSMDRDLHRVRRKPGQGRGECCLASSTYASETKNDTGGSSCKSGCDRALSLWRHSPELIAPSRYAPPQVGTVEVLVP